MSANWEDFVSNLKDGAGSLLRMELSDLITNAKGDSDAFIKRQGEKLELYLNQLANGQITKEQFQGYVCDIRDLTEMHALKMSVAGKASAQRLVDGVIKLVINGLIAMV